MYEPYTVINIRVYLDKEQPAYIGEEKLFHLLSTFSCPDNPDVEHFLLHNAIEFTKKDQSITYLVFHSENATLVGYFSLALKPISICTTNISKTMLKKLARVSVFDKGANSYTTAAYLIAQLGKNYSLPKEQQISGSVLLEIAMKIISNLKYSIGGKIEFLECEDNAFLLDFYTKNHFKPFNIRMCNPDSEADSQLLYQLLKII